MSHTRIQTSANVLNREMEKLGKGLLCRSRQVHQNATSIAKIGYDRAENGLGKHPKKGYPSNDYVAKRVASC